MVAQISPSVHRLGAPCPFCGEQNILIIGNGSQSLGFLPITICFHFRSVSQDRVYPRAHFNNGRGVLDSALLIPNS